MRHGIASPRTRSREYRLLEVASSSQALDDYLRHLAAEGRSRHTLDSTRLDLLQLNRYLGRQALQTVSTDDLRAFFGWLRRQHGNRPSSLRRKTSTVKGFFQFCRANDLIPADPSAAVAYPALQIERPPPLSPGECDRMLEGASPAAWRALVACLLDCGLKRDEVAALRWDDIDLDATPQPGLLHVRHRRASRRARRRTLGLSVRLAAALQAHGARPDRDGPVFPVSPRGVDFIVETCARRAGVRPDRKVTPQMLRDAYACARLAAFVEAEEQLAHDPRVRRAAQAEHDETLLRELGLSPASSAALRYRRMLQETQADRPEQPVLVDP
jgi:integrase/recombinase XerC